MSVVCNTSPLILLAKINRLDFLIHLYDEVLVPVSVLGEITVKSGRETSIIEAGMWIDETFYHRLLQEFGD